LHTADHVHLLIIAVGARLRDWWRRSSVR
jgi:hypothetical protein